MKESSKTDTAGILPSAAGTLPDAAGTLPDAAGILPSDAGILPSDDAPEWHPLDARTVQELWSKTYNTQGKPDWSHTYPYYHPDIVFQDSIQRLEGIEAFKALCERLTDRCKELRMDIHAVAQDGDVIFMQWTMTMMFKMAPSTPVYGSTVLRLHADGRIIGQRDYYDLWGDIFNGIPWFKKPYRKFMHKYFG